MTAVSLLALRLQLLKTLLLRLRVSVRVYQRKQSLLGRSLLSLTEALSGHEDLGMNVNMNGVIR